MKRGILALVAGLVVWVVVVSILNRTLRTTLEGYAAAEPLLAFTLKMKVARLIMSAVTCLIAGACVAAIAQSPRPAWVVGIVLTALFVPLHISIWHKLPVWYHLTFLLSLMPLVVAGDLFWLARRPRPLRPPS